MAERHVVIAGGGIIGCSIAYHLTLLQPATRVTIVERFGVASCASGKAGGFLAGGWGDSVTDELHTTSFAMHAQLARTLKLKSYRRLPTLQVGVGGRGKGKAGGHCGCEWLTGGAVRSAQFMDKDTAQVTPKELTNAFLAAAVAKGRTTVLDGAVTGLAFADGDPSRVTGVRVDETAGSGGGGAAAAAADTGDTVVPCDDVVVALGPWSVLAEDWFGPDRLRVPMEGIWSSSMIIEHPAGSVSPFALFCGEDGNGTHLEVYPRPEGSVYCCGLGGSRHVPPKALKALAPREVVPDPTRVAAARKSFARLSPALGKVPPGAAQAAAPDVTQACLRPCPRDGRPMMGRVPATRNAFLACGHNCWGILWGPASGKAMAELVLKGEATTVDLRAFDPARFLK